jgi:hypothetical protein
VCRVVTELRVHGVSGTRAEDVLDRPLLYRVAGDAEAAFLRPRPEYNASTGPGGAKLEAYRWGTLTAGAAARALWLLLLPFMLANVGYWMHPRAGRLAGALARSLYRVFALTMTVTFALAMVGISMDLVAWQCAAGPSCVDRPWLRFLGHGFFALPGRRLAVLALVPLALLGLLWFLGRRTWARYEAFDGTHEADGDGLSAPGFWRGRDLVGRLRGLHVAAAFGVVDAMLLGAVVPGHGDAAGRVLFGAVLALLVGCVVLLAVPGMAERDARRPWAETTARWTRRAAMLLTAAALGYAMLPRPAWATVGGLPGLGLALPVLLSAQMALLVLLAVLALSARAPGQLLAGLAGPLSGALGLGLAAAFSAGVSYRAADWLDRSAVPSAASTAGVAAPLQPPAAYAWAAFGFVVAVVAVCLGAGWIRLVTLPALRRAAGPVTDTDFPGMRAVDPARAGSIDAAIADARLADRATPVLAAVVLPVAAAAVAVTGLALAGSGPVDLAARGSRGAAALSFVTNLGTFLIGLAALGLVLLGMRAYREAGVRRLVGVLWDLGTFWPRAAHPLAPPCYAERVVPELATRVRWLACDGGGGGVVLSGHSQGSVLAVATVLQLDEETRRRVALLTYGSPLRRLYSRLFPAWFDAAVLERVGDSLTDFISPTRWVNLWRWTDPIGGWIVAPDPLDGMSVDDRRLVDPPSFGVPPGDTVAAAVQGHSHYPSTAGFAQAVADLVDRI